MEKDVVSYYATQSPITDPGAQAALLENFPATAPEICEVIQGLCLLFDEIYKYPIQNERVLDTNKRGGADMLAHIAAMDKKNPDLTQFRPEDQRFIASSSNFANLFVTVARQKGISARKRVGFVPYDGDWRIHDVAEYRDGDQWKLVDPSGIADAETFLPAAKAWQDCRARRVPEEKYRDEEQRGSEIARAALILDLAAMGKVELLNWDRYGWMCIPWKEFTEEQKDTLDALAKLLLQGDEAQEALIHLWQQEEGLRVPSTIYCQTPLVPPHTVELKL